MGLNIDVVKQGVGTTNDGNSARRFFENPHKVSIITGLDETLIEKFSVILQVISSGQPVDHIKFGEYCLKTAERYISLYKWYYMPSSVHKLLIHGAEIIQHAIVPIGQLSEEAQEARNKDFKHFREWNSRKCSRKATNEDILNNLLLSSDPYISTIKPILLKRNKKIMLPEALNLLNKYNEQNDSDGDGDDGDDDEQHVNNINCKYY